MLLDFLLKTLICFGLVLAAGCNVDNDQTNTDQERPQMENDLIGFAGKVSAYERGAMTDSFDDGGFSIFDACTIEIVSSERKGISSIKIYRESKSDAKPSLLEKVGQRLKFSISLEVLEKNSLIYQGALQDIEFFDEMEVEPK